MCVDSCVQRSEFCFDTYIEECSKLSVVWYIWQPPGQSSPQSERIVTSLKQKDGKKLEKLFTWAERVDPGASTRIAATMRLWEERTPGAEVIFTNQSGNTLAICS